MAKVQFYFAHVRDQLGGLQCVPKIREELGHLGGAFYIVGIVLHAKTLLIIYGGAGLDAYIDVLKGRLHFIDVMGVIGDDQGDIHLLPEGDQAFIDFRQLGNMLVALDLQKVAFAEPLFVPTGGLGCFHIVAVGEQSWDLC